MEGNNKEVKHRIKNLTGEYILIMKDRTVAFDLYPDERKSQSLEKNCDDEPSN